MAAASIATRPGFLSTLSLRRATRVRVRFPAGCGISIHALLAESDLSLDAQAQLVQQFLSTLSLRRATSGQAAISSSVFYFYPRSPCGERHGQTAFIKPANYISIHALLAESDAEEVAEKLNTGKFLSTLSLRRATRGPGAGLQ